MPRTATSSVPEVPNLCPPPIPSDVVRISAPQWLAFVVVVSLGVLAVAAVAWGVWRIAAAAEPREPTVLELEGR